MGKRWIAMALAVVTLLLCACNAKQEPTQPTQPVATQPVEETTPVVVQQPTVGVCMPREDAFWKEQSLLLSRHLEDIGYDVLVEYAAGDPKVQQNQLLEMVKKQVDCIILTAVDSYAMADALKQASLAGIPVVAYDRLPMYTEGVRFCVQPDHYGLGQQLAQYVVDTQLPEGSKEKTIEFLMGAPENENALAFYRGAMAVLQPYLDSGALVCRSKRTGFEDTAVTGESLQGALEQCYEYMQEHYEKSRPDILLCATDTLAEGCVYALENFAERVENRYPLIISVGGALDAVARVTMGKQAASVYIDRNEQAKQCAKLVYHLLLQEQLPEATLRSNGQMEVPCYYIAGQMVDAANYMQLLVAPGVYSQKQLAESLAEENRPEVTIPTATRPGTLPTRPPVPTEPETLETTQPTTPQETTPGQETTPTETTPVTTPQETTPPVTEPPATEPPDTTPPQSE